MLPVSLTKRNALYKIKRYKHNLQYLTPYKIVNCIKLLFDIKFRRTCTKSMPVFARINPFPLCNLSCGLCLIGFQKRGLIDKASKIETPMSLEMYKRILDKLSKSLLNVFLYDEGEPLLHPEIVEIIEYTSSKKIGTTISSNLAMKLDDEKIRKLVDSGLSQLIVAIDGTTQEIYSQYRVGGDLAVVRNNLERICAYKNKMKRKLPIIEYQFIDFGFNSHQLEKSYEYARSLNIDRFGTFKSFSTIEERDEFKRNHKISSKQRIALGCTDIYTIIDVDSGGFMYPCDFGEDHGMEEVGSLLDMEPQKLWNSERMQSIRASMKKNSKELFHNICQEHLTEIDIPKFLR